MYVAAFAVYASCPHGYCFKMEEKPICSHVNIGLEIGKNMQNKKTSKLKEIVYTGIFAALGLAILQFGFFIGTLEYFWYGLATLCIICAIAVGGKRCGLYCYGVIVILSFLIVPGQIFYILPFMCFMGLHPIALSWIGNRKWMFWIVKAWYISALYLVYKVTELTFLNIPLTTVQEIILIVVIGILTFWPYNFAVCNCLKKLAQIMKKIVK